MLVSRVGVLLLIVCLCAYASALAPPGHDMRMRIYRQQYYVHARALGLQPNPSGPQELAAGPRMEAIRLSTFLRAAHHGESLSERQQAANVAVLMGNNLGRQTREELQGPLHPDSVELQQQDQIRALKIQYQNLMINLNLQAHQDARGMIYNHPSIDPRWADSASSIVQLADLAIDLARY